MKFLDNETNPPAKTFKLSLAGVTTVEKTRMDDEDDNKMKMTTNWRWQQNEDDESNAAQQRGGGCTVDDACHWRTIFEPMVAPGKKESIREADSPRSVE